MTLGLIHGGGTGPELLESVRRCIDAIESRTGIAIEVQGFDDEKWAPQMELEAYDPGLHRALADFYDELRRRRGAIVRGSLPAPILYRLRRELDLAEHIVPLNPFPEISTAPGLKVVLLREANQGLYHFDEMSREDGEVTVTTAWREATVRHLAARAFELAETHGSRQVTTVLKTSVLGDLGGLWLEAFREESERHPQISYAHRPSGAGFSDMWLEPEQYGVVVTSDEAGDILADLVPSVLYGSRNLVATANLSPHGHASYQTDHGTIQPLRGEDAVNPVAMLGALAMALRYTGGLGEIADALLAAVSGVLSAGWHTSDLRCGPEHKRIGTRALTERILERLHLAGVADATRAPAHRSLGVTEGGGVAGPA
jgi:3-isopropylmalate dehydrogenase